MTARIDGPADGGVVTLEIHETVYEMVMLLLGKYENAVHQQVAAAISERDEATSITHAFTVRKTMLALQAGLAARKAP